MNEIRIPYKPNIIVFLLSTLFFGGCLLVLGNIALNNDRGLTLNRIIEFSQGGATTFYWILTGASAIFVIVGIVGIISSLTSKKEVVLTDTTISSPKNGMSNKIITVYYSDITDINIQTVQKQKFLNILHSGGKLTIPQSLLPNKQAFEELTEWVAARYRR